MKKNKFMFLGMSAIALALSLAFAGCVTVPGEEGTPSAVEAAAQLAAEFNAIVPGIAEAEGVTVTLTGGVRLEKALTVPAGVTLDLTRETLQLGNNAVLTVNGTVNARGLMEGGNEESLIIDGTVTINGSGTIHLTGKGSLLWIQNCHKLTLDGVTLVGVADNIQPLIVITEGSELILLSGAITGNNNNKDDGWWCGGGVNVGEQGTFTMSGGTISGNYGSGGGGGVGVQGTFIMSGGTISGNSGPWGGGGVAVFDGVGAGFTMTGGVISGNSAKDSGSQGGGVWVNYEASFTLEGGTIYGASEGTNANTADSDAALLVRTNQSGRTNAGTAKWGTGGTYTMGGVNQTGGSDILTFDPNADYGTDETLIAIPAQ